MLTVHHLGISQSERVVWLCEELEIDYEFKRYERRSDNRMAPDELKALHPMGTAPIINDGDLTLAESGAIIEYICGKYGDGRLTPGPESPDYATHLFWLHFANGTMMGNVMMAVALNSAGVSDMSEFVKNRTDMAWRIVEDHLAKAEYFGGSQFSSADIMMGFPLITVRAFNPRPLDDMPATRAYIEKIQARPAYKRAMEKAEPAGLPVA